MATCRTVYAAVQKSVGASPVRAAVQQIRSAHITTNLIEPFVYTVLFTVSFYNYTTRTSLVSLPCNSDAEMLGSVGLAL